MTSKDINKSPHPALQTILGNLHFATPRRVVRPLFETREDAERFIEMLANQGHEEEIHIRPVWNIDHEDLNKSTIRGWSVDSAQS